MRVYFLGLTSIFSIFAYSKRIPYLQQAFGNVTQINLPVSNRVVSVKISAHTLPFTPGAKFSLAFYNFYGNYSIYAGLTHNINMQVNAEHGKAFVKASANNLAQNLVDYVTPGEFVTIADQEFRVCLNQDAKFQAQYGTFDKTTIPLCSTSNPWLPKAVDCGFNGAIRSDLPMYRLDSSVGGCKNAYFGSGYLDMVPGFAAFNTYPGGVNSAVATLLPGDWISVGHPVDGEVFRVLKGSDTSLSQLQLATAGDASVPASLSLSSLQHATYQVQSVTLEVSDSL